MAAIMVPGVASHVTICRVRSSPYPKTSKFDYVRSSQIVFGHITLWQTSFRVYSRFGSATELQQALTFVFMFNSPARFCKPLVGSSNLSPGTSKIEHAIYI